ncbi:MULTISPECIES: energy-coupling factor transporter transmembrane protein EcfT [Fusobacterium]|uniref:energy-coupling factor transporter transmembrane protein EcfT n=1 Tax=Fusobacterium TaxID=848 RepID=UPI001EF0271A|nr:MULTISPECIES: energy-coupling factor transporter transmembrane protein EcfT [Fusobacterium]MCG6839421.1 energy-coupling factor transporter transmembrane protein EcfT [Fusobacterium nucleatum]WRL69861.1 energy-coupling factor transporter transmembrane protein EcfT [Fusobacterium polymorphum]
MLLKSSLFILLLVNIFTSNLIILSAILIVVFILNLTLNKNLKKHSKQLKVLLFFYLSTFLIQLYYGQQGKVLFKFYNFYITQEGLINFGVSFIRILNLILMSWLINEMKLLTGRFSKYQKIIDTVIDLVPEVFVLFKKRMKAKNFTRYILKDISKRYE